MVNYRITKYNPQKRNKDGHYTDTTEWTSISDIDKKDYDDPTFEQYKKVEDAYVEAIKVILNEKDISMLTIEMLELYDSKDDFEKLMKTTALHEIIVDYNTEIKTLKNGLTLNLFQIEKLIRLILRETIWMLLKGPGIKIKFGYDYYMYVTCSELSINSVRLIEKSGLFVEY